MFSFFFKIIIALQEKYYTKQIEAFFAWAKFEDISKEELVHIKLPNLEYIANLSKKSSSLSKTSPTFIICCKSTRREIFLQYSTESNNWRGIFHSPVIEIWENISRFKKDSLPVRFGIDTYSQQFLLNFARKNLEVSLNQDALVEDLTEENLLSRYLEEKVNVDVTLWVNGLLRGSQIIFDKTFLEGIRMATLKAANDSRFEKLKTSDLPKTTIQITVLHKLIIPLRLEEVKNNEVYPEKGYQINASGKKGYFLPAVANCIKLDNLDKFTNRLLTEKLSLVDNSQLEDIFVYEVNDFIESPQTKPLDLVGPVVERSIISEDQLISSIINSSLIFLKKMQGADGNVIARLNPTDGSYIKTDWTRLAYTALSLAAIYTETKNPLAEELVASISNFLEENLLSCEILEVTRCSALLTHRETLLKLNKLEKIPSYEKYLLEKLPNFTYDSILYAQYAHFLLSITKQDKKYLHTAEQLVLQIWLDFKDMLAKNHSFELAGFPELIPLLTGIGNDLNNDKYSSGAEEILDWYLNQQLPDGSFPGRNNKIFTYTRGTSKIFEVLVQFPEFLEINRLKTLSWLYNMQYVEENTFYINSKYKDLVLGGFRHDVFDHSVWIDSNAHVLYGISFLLRVKKLPCGLI